MLFGPPPLIDYIDQIDGADNATDIGANWRSDYSAMKLITNRAQLRTPASNTGRQGAWETFVGGDSGGRFLTDSGAVVAQLQAPVGASATDNSTCLGFAPDVPATGATWVYFLLTTGGQSAIMSYTQPAATIANSGQSSGLSGQTVRGPVVGAVANTALVQMNRLRYSATATLYQVYVNGSLFTSWDDTTNIAPANVLNRRGFIQAEGNFPLFSQAFYSPAVAAARVFDFAL